LGAKGRLSGVGWKMQSFLVNQWDNLIGSFLLQTTEL
jgi:hypothetical protein